MMEPLVDKTFEKLWITEAWRVTFIFESGTPVQHNAARHERVYETRSNRLISSTGIGN